MQILVRQKLIGTTVAKGPQDQLGSGHTRGRNLKRDHTKSQSHWRMHANPSKAESHQRQRCTGMPANCK